LTGLFFEQDAVEKPLFIGIRYASRALGCWHGSIEKHLGSPDAILRFGARDQKAWLEKRIDSILPHSETPVILWGRREATRFVGITTRTAQRILPDSLAVAFFVGFGGRLHALFHENQLRELRQRIKDKSIRVQRRSLKAPVFGAGQFPARHCLNHDEESSRIANARRESEFWSKML
jgi:hypothetical protein